MTHLLLLAPDCAVGLILQDSRRLPITDSPVIFPSTLPAAGDGGGILFQAPPTPTPHPPAIKEKQKLNYLYPAQCLVWGLHSGLGRSDKQDIEVIIRLFVRHLLENDFKGIWFPSAVRMASVDE